MTAFCQLPSGAPLSSTQDGIVLTWKKMEKNENTIHGHE
jgi:hypothetical protein